MQIYDMAVIGGGPAGYTAALYAARAGLTVIVLEQLSAGGQMTLTEQVDNYPGFADGVDGFTLGEQMQRGAERFGAKTLLAEVRGAALTENVKRLETSAGEILAKTVVLAMGAAAKKLGLPEEEALTGRGVHYCASCDGMRYAGKEVAVIGGGNSAVEDALTLSRIAKKVHLVHRRGTLRADRAAAAPLMTAENVVFHWGKTAKAILHEKQVEGLVLKDVESGAEETLRCEAVFVSVGRSPVTALVRGEVQLDAAGYVCADETTKTNLAGVFAAGDLRTKEVRQIITAAADGAVAANAAARYLAERSGT